MAVMSKIGRILASILLACLVSLLSYLFILLAPVYVFEFAYGRESILSAPGNGAAFFFWGAPVAAVAAFAAAIILSFTFYERLFKLVTSTTNSN